MPPILTITAGNAQLCYRLGIALALALALLPWGWHFARKIVPFENRRPGLGNS